MALFRPGADDEYCDYVYVLCVGRTPSILEIREGLAEDDALVDDDEEQLYLRVALSGLVRFAGVQQVAMRMSRAGGERVITEAPRTGVFDPILLRGSSRWWRCWRSTDIQHVDFGEIMEPPEGFDPGDYADRYAGVPCVANYLFYPQPCSAVVTSLAPRAS